MSCSSRAIRARSASTAARPALSRSRSSSQPRSSRARRCRAARGQRQPRRHPGPPRAAPRAPQPANPPPITIADRAPRSRHPRGPAGYIPGMTAAPGCIPGPTCRRRRHGVPCMTMTTRRAAGERPQRVRRHDRAGRRVAGDPRRRGGGRDGPVRLRQVDPAQHDRRAGPADLRLGARARRGPGPAQRDEAGPVPAPPDRHDLPVLQPARRPAGAGQRGAGRPADRQPGRRRRGSGPWNCSTSSASPTGATSTRRRSAAASGSGSRWPGP